LIEKTDLHSIQRRPPAGGICLIAEFLWWAIRIRTVAKLGYQPLPKATLAGPSILWLFSSPDFPIVGDPIAPTAALAIDRRVPARISVRERPTNLDTGHPHLVWTVPDIPIVLTGMFVWFATVRAVRVPGEMVFPRALNLRGKRVGFIKERPPKAARGLPVSVHVVPALGEQNCRWA
jgi:hypothetical protein